MRGSDNERMMKLREAPTGTNVQIQADKWVVMYYF